MRTLIKIAAVLGLLGFLMFHPSVREKIGEAKVWMEENVFDRDVDEHLKIPGLE